MTVGLSAIGNYGGLGSAGLYGSYYDERLRKLRNEQPDDDVGRNEHDGRNV